MSRLKICHTIISLIISFCLYAVINCEAKKPLLPPSRDTLRGTRLGSKAVPGEKIFNVKNFGAIPNGRKDNTQAFMKTWVAACHFKGRARVLIPPGVYALGPLIFAGPCIGPSPIIVQVSGTLKGDTDISLYEEPAWFQFENIDGLIVTGGGAFDGQGESAWKYNDCKNNNDCVQLPSNIKLNKVSNAILRGFTSADSKGVHIFITNSQNIRLKRLHIVAPGDSPNTDGVHISTSINVKVSKTIIATGDDCIGMIKGSTDVAINKVTCGPGHGISIGSLGKYENEEDVRGITVKNTTFLKTDNGIRIKTWPGSTPSLATGMIFQDLVMDNVRNPIIIDQGYCPSGCKKQPSRVKISNIQYINIRGTSSSEVGVNLMCSPQYQCENIHLFNINLKHIGNGPITATCANARVSTFGGLQSPRVTCHN
ncbi:exopolygalacturonase-like [Cannabis sativa]|uniref:exopolygalacturonase-like n=1 Tax=Cannabis sativa TaxID=3483 RepID=UPI0029CA3E93|nr:exopolygalacturonase-like [Cannabis sativa]